MPNAENGESQMAKCQKNRRFERLSCCVLAVSFQRASSKSLKDLAGTRSALLILHGMHADGRLTPSASPLLQESNELIAILTTIKKNSETNDNRG